jgi:nicotinamide phosphoribosyltransferase
MLTQYPEGLVACVSDSYDIYAACDRIWGQELHDAVLARKGTLVVRPDSGKPSEVVLKVMEILGERFGTSTNDKGFKVLHPNVRVIQGDGVDYDSIGEILSVLKQHGWSADNIAFGMGGALLQKLDRDTQKFAFKCSAAVVDGEERDVFKQPITDSGKNSKRGRLKLVRTPEGGFITLPEGTVGLDVLQTVFENGVVKQEYTFDDVKHHALL